MPHQALTALADASSLSLRLMTQSYVGSEPFCASSFATTKTEENTKKNQTKRGKKNQAKHAKKKAGSGYPCLVAEKKRRGEIVVGAVKVRPRW